MLYALIYKESTPMTHPLPAKSCHDFINQLENTTLTTGDSGYAIKAR